VGSILGFLPLWPVAGLKSRLSSGLVESGSMSCPSLMLCACRIVGHATTGAILIIPDGPAGQHPRVPSGASAVAVTSRDGLCRSRPSCAARIGGSSFRETCRMPVSPLIAGDGPRAFILPCSCGDPVVFWDSACAAPKRDWVGNRERGTRKALLCNFRLRRCIPAYAIAKLCISINLFCGTGSSPVPPHRLKGARG